MNSWLRYKTFIAAFAFAAAISTPVPVWADPNDAANLSLKLEIKRAIDKGLNWLGKNQHEDGYWSTEDHPAVTALALTAFKREPGDYSQKKFSQQIDDGYFYILSCVHDDGSIYRKKELLNYNTAVSMIALVAADNPNYEQTLRRARNFVVGLQQDFDEKGKLDNALDGGIGYGGRYPHSDMSNTTLALEALYYTSHLVSDDEDEDMKKLNWKGVRNFLQNSQNLPEVNGQKWASNDPKNKGGFVYFPGNTKSETDKLPDGREALRSYGSISYAGMLSYIYADLKKDDPRITAVLDWLKNNYTLKENPGMGPQGLFYYFHTMTKALTLANIDELPAADGTMIDWRKQLALRLINLQKTDGKWINDSARWWENDPALVTSYALLALEMIHHDL
ncbi:MAG: squalene-hopene/tetraprenyl-beta-curcumene cyclase [Candidatus Binatia bacterium]|jgi:squalene-hopene/tetraprenyl-beta-curcumene cyclase